MWKIRLARTKFPLLTQTSHALAEFLAALDPGIHSRVRHKSEETHQTSEYPVS